MNEHPLPDRRKHGYAELEKRLEDHAISIEKRLARLIAKALLGFAVIGITSAGALLGFGVVLKEQNRTSSEIQTQRYEASFQTCLAQNERHDAAIKKAKVILPKQAQQTVILLVNELQPFVEDCDKQARTRVKGNADGK